MARRNGEAIPKEEINVYVYCVFCQTHVCDRIAIQAQQIFDCRAVSPKQEQRKWVRGQAVRETHDLLPGYVFLYADREIEQPLTLRNIPGVIRCLSDQEHRYILQGSDEAFALMLLEKDGIIGKTRVYQEGEMIRICEGAFAGVETKILKVNRRNMRMLIQIPFANMQISTWVEYEMVKPSEEAPGNTGTLIS